MCYNRKMSKNILSNLLECKPIEVFSTLCDSNKKLSWLEIIAYMIEYEKQQQQIYVNKSVYEKIFYGNNSNLLRFFNLGLDVNYEDRYNKNLLWSTSLNRTRDIPISIDNIDLIMSKMTDVNKKNVNGQNIAFFLFSEMHEYDYIEIFDLISKYNVNYKDLDNSGRNLLFYISTNRKIGKSKIINVLLNEFDVSKTDHSNETALDYLIVNKGMQGIETLLINLIENPNFIKNLTFPEKLLNSLNTVIHGAKYSNLCDFENNVIEQYENIKTLALKVKPYIESTILSNTEFNSLKIPSSKIKL